MSEEILRLHVGRDILRQQGWIAFLILIPRRDLMARDEEGLLVLCGLALTLRGWPLRVDWRSDAGEIPRRIARSVGA